MVHFLNHYLVLKIETSFDDFLMPNRFQNLEFTIRYVQKMCLTPAREASAVNNLVTTTYIS